MPIGTEQENKKATQFEIEIYAELHNLINIADEFKATKANIVILTKLCSVVKKKDVDKAKTFTDQMTRITAPNLRVNQTIVLDELGYEFVDKKRGIEIPTTQTNYNSSYKLFLQLQHRIINTELSVLIVDVLNFLMDNGLFTYDAEREGELYRELMTGRGMPGGGFSSDLDD
jgi:hypothetical protein